MALLATKPKYTLLVIVALCCFFLLVAGLRFLLIKGHSTSINNDEQSKGTDDEIVTERSIYDLLAEALKADEDEDGVPNPIEILVDAKGPYTSQHDYVSAVEKECTSLVARKLLTQAQCTEIETNARRSFSIPRSE